MRSAEDAAVAARECREREETLLYAGGVGLVVIVVIGGTFWGLDAANRGGRRPAPVAEQAPQQSADDVVAAWMASRCGTPAERRR
jgi:hypothetical protein